MSISLSINGSSVSSLTNVTTKIQGSTDATSASKDDVGSALKVDASGANASQQAGGAQGTASSPQQQQIEQLKKMIAEAQKQLQQQQQQLAQLNARKMSEDEKNTQVMAVQSQILGTTARLQALQASLFQLLGGTTA